ncbi:hypothetical protein MtrunA17_Chr7g0238221 [Medicago truncatula]|uniref:Transmembrane protein, putative n=1 Tax=Medicago truncatula TaxID=3880 RepID=G7L3D7_MEDTR|nr:transmembrane protein, putative [Medicago truncatula]RHN46067.1 hypothetical protein MtrunA17_Chr7g0238221 [Medicago truncatula]
MVVGSVFGLSGVAERTRRERGRERLLCVFLLLSVVFFFFLRGTHITHLCGG